MVCQFAAADVNHVFNYYDSAQNTVYVQYYCVIFTELST